MADVALKQVVPSPGAAAREQLHALDDSDLVAAFLDGEERAFQELVERYQTRLPAHASIRDDAGGTCHNRHTRSLA